MKIEESFMQAVLEIQKTYPVLKQQADSKVTIRVSAIIAIAREFHARGWKDSDPLSMFNDLLKAK